MILKSLNKAISDSFKLKNRFFSSSYKTIKKQVKTAGIIVIGDEILRGDVLDINSNYMAKQLYSLGIKVKKISILGDLIEDVSKEVYLFSNSYNYVITSGGIGPTHDDITFEAVAKAFNEPLICNPEMQKICERFYETKDPKHAGMKLAHIPQTAKLNFVKDAKFPQISMRNVHMFPGIPELVQKWFGLYSEILFHTEAGIFHTKSVYLNLREDEITDALNELVKEFPNVQFGSYPKMFHEMYKVKITIESRDEDVTMAAYFKLLEKFPKHSFVDL